MYEERRLKSTAQIVFLFIVQGIDDTLENAFKSFEEKVGREFLAVGGMSINCCMGL